MTDIIMFQKKQQKLNNAINHAGYDALTAEAVSSELSLCFYMYGYFALRTSVFLPKSNPLFIVTG